MLTVVCTAAAAVACAVGYALSKERRPIVFMSPEAAEYARQALFPDTRQMAAFSARLQSLAEATGTSVAVTYLERPRPGETLKAGIDRSLADLEQQLAGRPDDAERSTLAIVLMGKPRSFAFAGLDRAGTRLALRNLSGNAALRRLKLRHVQAVDGRFLTQSLDIAQHALRPLHVLVEYYPTQGAVPPALEKAASFVPELPGDTIQAVAKAVREPLARLTADSWAPPIVLFLVALGALALVAGGIEAVIVRVIKAGVDDGSLRRGLETAVSLTGTLFSIPLAGVIAVIFYGSLEDIATLSQISGQPALDLIQWARGLPAPAVPFWPALVASCIIALGGTLRFGLKLTNGDPYTLAMPGCWFSSVRPSLRALPLGILGVVLTAPVPFAIALSSMEGLMGVTLLSFLSLTWGLHVWFFWQALGARKRPAL